ncbi:MAG: hypothetical protein ACREHE_14425 [Rhizomicrobium sp.]
MPVAQYAQNVQTPFFPMVRHANDWRPAKPGATAEASTAATPSTTPAEKTADAASGDGKGFWQDVLDVVNPLQHLPIVGTIYRSITGDKMGDLEKVAGDTLYGGPIGLASSLADVAFEKLTGKDFEDTLMGWAGLGSDEPQTAVASAQMKPLPPRTTQAATITPVITPVNVPAMLPAAKPDAAKQPSVATAAPANLSDANAQALMSAMNQNGVDADLGMRALFAYQKSLGLAQTGSGPAP